MTWFDFYPFNINNISRYADQFACKFIYCSQTSCPQSTQTIGTITRMKYGGSANINPLGRWRVSDIHEARRNSLTEQLSLPYLLLYLLQYNYPH